MSRPSDHLHSQKYIMQILTKLGALRKKAVPKEIGGQTFSFYPVRVGKIITGELRSIVTPITNSISALMSAKAQDQEVLEEVTPDGTVSRARRPASPEMVRYRSDKRDATYKEASEVLFSDETRLLIGRVIMDSLRDDCPRTPTEEQVKQFVDDDAMDLPTFIEFIKGMMAANKSIFGDLGNLLRERVNEMLSATLPSDTPEMSMDDDSPTSSDESAVPE